MTISLRELGCQLVEDSNLNEEFSAQRGLINEMFPYIYEASKRMSSRAISRWLEANKIKLSAATIAKALRNPKPLWEEVLEEVEPAAFTFARAHDVEVQTLLENEELFCALQGATPTIAEGVTDEGARTAFDEYQAAGWKLKEDWFSLPEQAREACLSCAPLSIDEKDVEEKEPTVEEAKG
jgi:hypothetical protein